MKLIFTVYLFLVASISCSLAQEDCSLNLRGILRTNNGQPSFKWPYARDSPPAHCESGNITWASPDNERILYFYKGGDRFRLCFRHPAAISPNAVQVYQYKDGGRYSLSFASMRENELCMQSYCGHITLQIVANNATEDTTFSYNYTDVDNKSCTLCTESCATGCMCKSDHIVFGQVLSVKESKVKSQYIHKVRALVYIKYNDCNSPALSSRTCPLGHGVTPPDHVILDPNNATSEQIHRCIRGPKYIEVTGKCKLKENGHYVISAYNKTDVDHRQGVLQMTLCCAQTHYEQVRTVYQSYLNRNTCCRY